MKERFIFYNMFLAWIVSVVSANEKGLTGISPGCDCGIASIGQVCPTFSRTAVDWATTYHVKEVINGR